MKISGIDFSQPSNVIIPIIRGNAEIIFQACCIVDFTELDAVLKAPNPVLRLMRGSQEAKPVQDEKYKKELEEFGRRRIDYIIAKSLLATPDLVWETVDFNNPETYKNYETELQEAGFNTFQITQLATGALEANGLSERKVTEAREHFLAGQQERSK
jgi:hypothetical protein